VISSGTVTTRPVRKLRRSQFTFVSGRVSDPALSSLAALPARHQRVINHNTVIAASTNR
jgi:hypothetical protein